MARSSNWYRLLLPSRTLGFFALFTVLICGLMLAAPPAAAETVEEVTPFPSKIMEPTDPANTRTWFGQVAPGGEYAVYAIESGAETRQVTLAWANLETGDLQIIFEATRQPGAAAPQAQISANGLWVAYFDPSTPTHPRRWNATTGESVPLDEPAAGQYGRLQIAADGSAVAWETQTGGAVSTRFWSDGVLTSVEGCQHRLLRDGTVAEFSSMKDCSFTASDDGSLTVHDQEGTLLDSGDGSVIAQLAGVTAYSADGKSVALRTATRHSPDHPEGESANYVYRADSETYQLITLPFETSAPIGSLSGDGMLATVSDEDGNLWLLDFSYRFEPPLSVEEMSQAQLSAQVDRLYQAYFLREADGEGLEEWVSARSRGMSLVEASRAFAASAEFTNRYGTLDDSAFVDLVYTNVLGREPDAEGRTFWLEALASGMPRAEMMVGFSESFEFSLAYGPIAAFPLDAQIWRLYLAYFLRPADEAGFEFWVMQGWIGTSIESISDTFASSPEFINRYGALDDAAFVDLVYENVLGRAPDEAGATFWRSKLADGTTRGEVMLAFSESPEFVRTTNSIPNW